MPEWGRLNRGTPKRYPITPFSNQVRAENLTFLKPSAARSAVDACPRRRLL
jgi:hypothetical protein